MKVKHFLSGATLLSAALLLNAPLSAAVESDTVGYTTIEMQAGKWYQIGNPFVGLEKESLATLGKDFSSGFSAGDRIYVYDSSTSTYAKPVYWNPTTNSWGTLLGESVDINLKEGQAIFVYKATSGTVTLKGRVAIDTPVSVGAENGSAWAQIVCLYPGETALNELKWEGFNSGDRMYLYDSETSQYQTPVYWNAATQTWGDLFGTPANDVTLNPGQAMFIYKNTGVGTCTPAAN